MNKKRKVSLLIVLVLFVIQLRVPVLAGGSVTVTDNDEFMAAISQNETNIVIDGVVTVTGTEGADGKTEPVIIPANTVITGNEGSELFFRCPIQLGGDNVMFKDVNIGFTSSGALGSTVHREIFLAGYSLILDNVDTYQEGAGGNLGGFGGDEEELLPTVYGGAYEGTTNLGSHASITVTNSNDKTMFKAIYMGNEEESDNKIPYKGVSSVTLDGKALVREYIDVQHNSSSTITIADTADIMSRVSKIVGNTNTTLTLEKVSMRANDIKNVGNVILDNGAVLEMGAESSSLCNVELKNGSKLDYSNAPEAYITGDFVGGDKTDADEVLMLDMMNGTLTISGNVSGKTLVNTDGGSFVNGHTYIIANGTENDFYLSDTVSNNGYELKYENGQWIGFTDAVIPVISKIELGQYPAIIDSSTLPYSVFDMTDSSPKFEGIWYDENLAAYGTEDVYQNYFIETNAIYNPYVICIKTEYLESTEETVLKNTNWGNTVFLDYRTLNIDTEEEAVEEDNYYFCKDEDVAVLSGKYTFLFCSMGIDIDGKTAEEVINAVDGLVMAEMEVTFYDSSKGEEAPTEPESPSEEESSLDESEENSSEEVSSSYEGESTTTPDKETTKVEVPTTTEKETTTKVEVPTTTEEETTTKVEVPTTTEKETTTKVEVPTTTEEETTTKVEVPTTTEKETTTKVEVPTTTEEETTTKVEVPTTTEEETTTKVEVPTTTEKETTTVEEQTTVKEEPTSEKPTEPETDKDIEKELEDRIENAVEGGVIKVEVNNKNVVVSADLFKKAADKKLDLVLGFEKYTWKFSDINTDTEGVKSLEVIIGADIKEIKDVLKDSKLNENKTHIISFTHDGILPGKAEVTLDIDKKFSEGKELYFYYYNEKEKAFEYISKTAVKDGKVIVNLTHCSDYVLLEEELPREMLVGTNGSANTGEQMPIALYMMVMSGMAGTFVVVTVSKAKKEE